jgi:hypothetical protein
VGCISNSGGLIITRKILSVGSREETVIDYGIVNQEAWERVEEFRIGGRVESDHLPLEISIEANNEERGKGRETGEQKKVVMKI